jgi:hypothetical protein
MTSDDQDLIPVSIQLGDPDLAVQIEAWLTEHGARDVDSYEQHGILPILPFVVAGVIAVTAITSLVMWIRDKTQCQILIDATTQPVRKEVDCSVRDGRIIVVTGKGTKVHIENVPPAIDLTAIIKAAMGGKADDVAAAAKAAGGSARVDEG